MKQHEINRQRSLERVMRVIDLQEQGMSRREACERLGFRQDTTARAMQNFARLGNERVLRYAKWMERDDV